MLRRKINDAGEEKPVEMKMWNGFGGSDAHPPRIMVRLTRLPSSVVSLSGMAALAAIVTTDIAAREIGLRLVPLYVPVLCVICWALGRWRGMVFALVAALIAIAPDVMASSAPLSVATATNAILRMITYVFLALIIVAYRHAYDEADLRAMYDGLTGLLNKMSFHAAAKQQVAAALRTRQTLLILYVDLDGFKTINSLYGHAAGDAALKAFAAEAKTAIRGSDLVGRLGGDEFGLLVAASSEDNAEALARLLHQRLTTTLAKSGLPLSCSMGGLIIRPRPTIADIDLFDIADRIMRRAKADGKNKVLTETMGDASGTSVRSREGVW